VRLFPNAHHDGLQPTQLGVVWYLHLHADTEGPTFISTTARQSSASVFYIRTSQSSSGHTNALAESFNATLKVERVNRTVYPTREDARKDVVRYIELHYNTKRLHSALGYRTPQEARTDYQNQRQAA
jgi:transposase InsO family protein